MKIFVTGASGYIGGSVAALFASRGHQVRGLVRSANKVDGVRAKGIQPVIGTLDNSELLTAEAKVADAVINAADSDHQGAVEALLAGLAGSGRPFIHTSGTSLVGDEAMGEPSDAIFTEDTPVKLEPDKEHRVALNKLIIDAPRCAHHRALQQPDLWPYAGRTRSERADPTIGRPGAGERHPTLYRARPQHLVQCPC